jgi:tetratricopeptide (TPR) repeat protein
VILKKPRECGDVSALPIPMTAQDVRRRRIRFVMICLSPILVVAPPVAWYSHHQSALKYEMLVYQDAAQLEKAGAYRDAARRLDLAITLNPADLKAYLLRAMTRHNLGDNRRAVIDATEVINRSPAPVMEAFQVRALAYWDLRDYQRVVEDLNHALELRPSWAAGYTLRGNAYWQTGDSSRAIQDFSQSISVEPSFEGYYQRGSLREMLGDYRSAMDDYTSAADLQPNTPDPYRARAGLRKRFGNLAGAQADEARVSAIKNRITPERPPGLPPFTFLR